MAASRRNRRDPRTESTRIALIEAAEFLFARFGLASVSMRQIGAAIGSGNNTVVAYHFGSKEELVTAIYLHRLPAIDARRRELLAEADKDGPCTDLPTLLRVLWLPLLEQTDDEGHHSFARFLASMMQQGLGRTRRNVDARFPATLLVVDRIAPHLPYSPGQDWEARWRLVTTMALEGIRNIDEALGGRGKPGDAERMFADFVAMAAAALSAAAPKIP